MRLRYGVLASVAAVVFGLVTGIPAQAVADSKHYTGSLPDGATWVADVPSAWNGTIILYSHGYGPLVAQNAPDDATRQALLDAGYALTGSSYSGPSMWALESAVSDQFATLDAVERTIGHPARRTIAWGTSMGGLVSALEAEDFRHRVDGALSTCGLVAGALNLNNYQLDGEYALAKLLAPQQQIKLVRFANQDEALGSALAMTGIVNGAKGNAQGLARIALAAALLNEPTWSSGDNPPSPTDYRAQAQQQAEELGGFLLTFIVTGRQQIELAAGGNSAYNAGVDYRALLNGSSQAAQVRALYRDAGLDLDADLSRLTRDADIHADPGAVVTLARTSMATGRPRVPELNLHTVADQLIPVQQENWYGRRVHGDLRQAYVHATGHCAFRPSETIAALHALEHRVETGRWDRVTEPDQLNAAAAGLGLGDPRYVRFTPSRLTGGLGEHPR